MSRKTPGEVRARTCGTKSPSRSEALRFINSSKSPSTVDGDLDELIKRSASDRLGNLVPQVRARTSPGVFRDMALLGLCLELSFKEYRTCYGREPCLVESSAEWPRTLPLGWVTHDGLNCHWLKTFFFLISFFFFHVNSVCSNQTYQWLFLLWLFLPGLVFVHVTCYFRAGERQSCETCHLIYSPTVALAAKSWTSSLE